MRSSSARASRAIERRDETAETSCTTPHPLRQCHPRGLTRGSLSTAIGRRSARRGIAKAAPLFKRAKGCKAMSLHRSVEKRSRYRLFLTWDTVENHTKDFYGSADWQEWRKLVAHTFEGPPSVEHVQETLKAF